MEDDKINVIVTTSDVSINKVVPGFIHLFNKYWGASQKVTIVGFSEPKSILPKNFEFVSAGRFEDYPANKWSNYLMKTLTEFAPELFVLFLDDYWITRKVDVRGVKIARDYMQQFENVIKFDLTYDRLYSDPGKYHYGYHTYDHAGHLDLIKSPAGIPYHMSLWGGMWRNSLLKKILVPNETAQQIELSGTPRLSSFGDSMLVLGTRQAPVLHGNILQSSKEHPVYQGGGWEIKQSLLEEMREEGLLKNLE